MRLTAMRHARALGFIALVLITTQAVAQVAAPADPDGDDDPVPVASGTIPRAMHFERIGRPPRALRRVCDLTALDGALYLAEANSPLGSDGATLARFSPTAPTPFTLAFDWNRPGRPTRGGGAGQGFVRVHALDGRLYVPDADPPYAGFGFVDPGTEGYVFVSDHHGRFAPARGENLLPPAAPDALDRPGAAVLPRAYHVLDAIRWRGMFVASTGSVPPRARAWSGPSPGALHVADPTLRRWTFSASYPASTGNNVWRLGFLVRFQGRLFAGIQDYFGRDPNDYVIVDAPMVGAPITDALLHPQRITPGGAAQTLRWYADRGTLYWIAWDRTSGVALRATTDGTHWTTLALPPDAGSPADIVRFRDGLVVLAEGGLYRLDGTTFTRLAVAPTTRIQRQTRPVFAVNDIFCAPPLGILGSTLYAGDSRQGALWRLVDDP